MDSELQKFLDRLAEVLVTPSVAPDDDFRKLSRWNSLVGFSVMVMIDLDYGRAVTLAEIDAARTAADLAALAGAAPAREKRA